jgi:hypothetical protein
MAHVFENLHEADVALLEAARSAPFIDVFRAIYRTMRLQAEMCADVISAELENIDNTFELSGQLKKPGIVLFASPDVAKGVDAWDYKTCEMGAWIWLPDIGRLWLFVGYSDEGSQLTVGIEVWKKYLYQKWKQRLHCEKPEEKKEGVRDRQVILMERKSSSSEGLKDDISMLLRDFLDGMQKGVAAEQ